jgi:CheY-like chemotaxis protein
MSKIEASKLELSPISFNFERMLLKVLAVIDYRVEEKRQRLTVNVENKIPFFILGDDQRLAQVITNLLSNAVKFTPDEGEIFLDVTMASKKDGLCELRIAVRDTGIGISSDQQENIFAAFSQADSGVSRKYGGTGLGLVISQRIVELMGGVISVESEAGKGSRFSFSIKVPYSDENIDSLLDPNVPWKTMRVLVADNSTAVRQYFQDFFNRMDIQCLTAADGLEVCRIIEEHDGFDIYFIDWYMPKINGAELIKWIKSHKISGKVVLCDFIETDNLQEIALKAGADRYLTNPLLNLSIIDCINDCFGHTANHENQEQNYDFTGKTLLVVEDIEINREIILTLLADTGLNIECAENGKEALDIISTSPEKYNAVFMDLQMPVMDGLEATTRIRALPMPECKKLPIIAMTANVFKDDIERCIAAGMNDHIGKPLNLEEVFNMLRKYLSDQNT